VKAPSASSAADLGKTLESAALPDGKQIASGSVDEGNKEPAKVVGPEQTSSTDTSRKSVSQKVADGVASQPSQVKSEGVKSLETGSKEPSVMKIGQTAVPSTGSSCQKASPSAADQKGGATNKDAPLLERLMKLTPKELMNEIVGGRVPVSLLDKVAERLPAEMLQEAVDFLTNVHSSCIVVDSDSPGDQTGSKKLAATGEGDKVGSSKKDATVGQAVKPAALQSIKSTPSSVSSTPVSHSSGTGGKALLSDAGNTGSSSLMASPSKGPVKRKLEGLDASKLKDMEFDDMLELFQQTLQDVLGRLFTQDKLGSTPSSVAQKNASTLSTLPSEDRKVIQDIQKSYNIKDVSSLVEALRVLRSLDPSVVIILGDLDPAIVKKSVAGNEFAERVGGKVLHQLASFVAQNKKPTIAAPKPPVAVVSATRQPEKRKASTVPSLTDVQRGFVHGQPLPKLARFDSPHMRMASRQIHPEPFRGSLLPSPNFPQRPGATGWRAPPNADRGFQAGVRPLLSQFPRPPPRGGFGSRFGPY
jgi:hypothetical protein